MRRRVLFVAEAADELREARRWYNAQRQGLGREMAGEVARTLRAVVETPERYPWVEGNFRRALVHRFPYGVFFRERDDVIVVVGVLHLHRDMSSVIRR